MDQFIYNHDEETSNIIEIGYPGLKMIINSFHIFMLAQENHDRMITNTMDKFYFKIEDCRYGITFDSKQGKDRIIFYHGQKLKTNSKDIIVYSSVYNVLYLLNNKVKLINN